MSTVNPKIVDSVNLANVSVLANAASESHGVGLQSFAFSISMLMMNAVATQNASAQIANAAVATTCAKILAAANRESTTQSETTTQPNA